MEQSNYSQPPGYNGDESEATGTETNVSYELPHPVSQDEIDEDPEVEDSVTFTRNLFNATVFTAVLPFILNFIFFKFMLKDKYDLAESEGYGICLDLAEALAYIMGGLFIWRFYRYLYKFRLTQIQRYSLLGVICAFVVSAMCTVYTISLDEYETDTAQNLIMFETCLLSMTMLFVAFSMYQLNIKMVGLSMIIAAVVPFVVVLYARTLMEDLEDIDFYTTFNDIKAIFLKSLIAELFSVASMIFVYQTIAEYMGVRKKRG